MSHHRLNYQTFQRFYFDPFVFSVLFWLSSLSLNDNIIGVSIQSPFLATDLATEVRASVFRSSPVEVGLGVAGGEGHLGKSIRIYPPVTGQLGLILRDKRIEI